MDLFVHLDPLDQLTSLTEMMSTHPMDPDPWKARIQSFFKAVPDPWIRIHGSIDPKDPWIHCSTANNSISKTLTNYAGKLICPINNGFSDICLIIKRGAY